MNFKKVSLNLLAILFAISLQAQEGITTVDKQILILSSSTSYMAAQQVALEAADKMNRELKEDRKLTPNKETGLTMSAKDCDELGWGYPCYGARGQEGALNTYYISVEHSNAYEELSDGYYIVVMAVDNKNSEIMKANHKLAKTFYPDAYVKNIQGWIGCSH